MKGFIPVEIPTKRYIKAYVHAQFGEKPFMEKDCLIGAKLYDVLTHKKNERKKQFSNVRYNTKMKIYVSYHTFLHRGAYLNETNITNFNLYIEQLIKDQFRMHMDLYISILPNFQTNLQEVRKKLGIDTEEWDDDSMRKDYYRYRLQTGKPLLYTKTSSQTADSDNYTDFSF